mgnify:CR=1 FL=1|jgi:cephalosporin hydroxylase|tara:strand:+ start:986 stop:1618 length:633 start_codon:yes stop_codon:yes gene_type:complete
MKTLTDLARECGNDKIKDCHSFGGSSYMDHYERLFRPIKDDVKVALEIGVNTGTSIGIWSEYFANAKILGLDINPECLRHNSDRAEIFIGSQDEVATLSKITDKYPLIDIVIDDGSHLVDDMISSFEYLFPFVKNGGYYVIEDLYTTYRDLTEDVKQWPGMHLTKDTSKFVNNRAKMDRFFSDIVRGMDLRMGEVFSLSFVHQMAVFTKV